MLKLCQYKWIVRVFNIYKTNSVYPFIFEEMRVRTPLPFVVPYEIFKKGYLSLTGMGRVLKIYKIWGRIIIFTGANLPSHESSELEKYCSSFVSLPINGLYLASVSLEAEGVKVIPRYGIPSSFQDFRSRVDFPKGVSLWDQERPGVKSKIWKNVFYDTV